MGAKIPLELIEGKPSTKYGRVVHIDHNYEDLPNVFEIYTRVGVRSHETKNGGEHIVELGVPGATCLLKAVESLAKT